MTSSDSAEPDDQTVLSSRRAASPEPDELDDATVLSARRAPTPVDVSDDTQPAVRSRSLPAPLDDSTTVASRRSAALPETVDATVLSRRPAPAEDALAGPVDETLLRPAAGMTSATGTPVAPLGAPVAARDARIPDAAALRAPSPPRAAPPVTITRTPAPSATPASGRPAVAHDHESLERAARRRGRRRMLVAVLAAAIVAVASGCALYLLLT